MSRRFFAPGKVVVVGEYAVVDGAPAVVAAVGIGVGLRWSASDTRDVQTPYGDTRFVDAALHAAAAPTGLYTFSDDGGPALASKPGLGGSAAATVVAVHAARTLRGEDPSPDAVYAIASDVHRAVQGSGSGIDVAASTYGGMVRFQRGQTPTPVKPSRLVVVWTGASAKTGPRVERYLAWGGRAPFVARSAELTDLFLVDPLRAVEEDYTLLVSMSEQAGVDYRTPALDRIVELAWVFDGAAKPSGAGGGDCAIAVFAEPDSEAKFITACAGEGFTVLGAELSDGVRELT